jgi:hypothetical protein
VTKPADFTIQRALPQRAHPHGRPAQQRGCPALVGLVLLTGLALTSVATCADTAIVPGKRVGAVALGMHRAQVEKLLGAAQISNEVSPHRTNASWPLPGRGSLHVQFIDGVATRVATNAKEYSTSDGLAVGASPAEVRALHARTVETDYSVARRGGVAAQCHDDVAAGIGFEFDKGPAQREFVLRGIYVHAAGKAAACVRDDDPQATHKIGATEPDAGH